MRRIIGSILGTVALLLGGIFTGQAAVAGGGLPLVLAPDPRLCIITHGPYAQVTLGVSSCGSFIFAVVGTTSQGWHLVTITDGNGHCLTSDRAGTAAVVKPRACRASEWWIDRLSPPTQGADDTYTWGKSDNQLGTAAAAIGAGVVTSDSPRYRVWASP